MCFAALCRPTIVDCRLTAAPPYGFSRLFVRRAIVRGSRKQRFVAGGQCVSGVGWWRSVEIRDRERRTENGKRRERESEEEEEIEEIEVFLYSFFCLSF